MSRMKLAMNALVVLSFATVFGSGAIAHVGHEEGAEPDIEIYLGEMYVRPSDGEPGEPITTSAGELNLIRVVNEGAVEHELHFGIDPDVETGLYRENLFGPDLDGEHAAHGFLGVVLAPGESANLHVWIPESRTGEWEMACFVPGHYEAGQKAHLIIE